MNISYNFTLWSLCQLYSPSATYPDDCVMGYLKNSYKALSFKTEFLLRLYSDFKIFLYFQQDIYTVNTKRGQSMRNYINTTIHSSNSSAKPGLSVAQPPARSVFLCFHSFLTVIKWLTAAEHRLSAVRTALFVASVPAYDTKQQVPLYANENNSRTRAPPDHILSTDSNRRKKGYDYEMKTEAAMISCYDHKEIWRICKSYYQIWRFSPMWWRCYSEYADIPLEDIPSYIEMSSINTAECEYIDDHQVEVWMKPYQGTDQIRHCWFEAIPLKHKKAGRNTPADKFAWSSIWKARQKGCPGYPLIKRAVLRC